MLLLKSSTNPKWLDAVMNDFSSFLSDHAAAEKKASGMALSMISHYPNKTELIKTMADIAIEELIHFKQVLRLMMERNLQLQPDIKDEYINRLRQHFRKGSDVYFLDRLLIGAIVEARGCERFSLIANALPQGKLKEFYEVITRSEQKHYEVFTHLAYHYFNKETVNHRLQELLNAETDILVSLPIRAALH